MDEKEKEDSQKIQITDFRDNLMNKFNDQNIKDFTFEEVSEKEKYLPILLTIKKIQLYAKSENYKKDIVDFNFDDFFKDCIDKVELKDIQLIDKIFEKQIKSDIYKKNVEPINLLIKKFYEQKNLVSFTTLVENLSKVPSVLKMLDFLFPYKEFYYTPISNVCLLMNLIVNLAKASINFSLKIGNKEIKFEMNKSSQTRIHCVFCINKNYLLDIGTSIYCKQKEKEKSPTLLFSISAEKLTDLIYIALCTLIKEKKIDKVTDKEIVTKINEAYRKFQERPKVDSDSFQFNHYFRSNKSSLFGKAWSLVYNLNDNMLSFVSTFCYPLEKSLLDLAKALYDIVEPSLIEEIVKLCYSMKEFCNSDSILWKIHTNQFVFDKTCLDDYADAIKREKGILDKVFSQNIQLDPSLKSKILDTLAKVDKEIEGYIIDDIKDKEKREKIEQLHKLKVKLTNLKTNDTKILCIQDDLLQYINKYTDNDNLELTEAILKDISQKINSSEDPTKEKKKQIQKDENRIEWPDYLIKEDQKIDTESTKLLDIIIWYSKIINSFEFIKKDIKANVLKGINKLNEFTEMKNISTLLLDITKGDNIKGNNFYFSEENLKIIYGTINAYFIYKMIQSEIFGKLWEIDSFFNEFALRKEIKDPYFISKTISYANDLENSFRVHIPKILCTDFFFLFLNVVKNNEKEQKSFELGPLLQEYKCNSLISYLKLMVDDLLLRGKYLTATSIMEEISKYLYIHYISSKENAKPENFGTIDMINEKINETKEQLNKENPKENET